MKNKNIFLLLSLSLIAFACEKTDSTPALPYDNGVIVVNAGNFSDNNGTLSLIQRNGTAASIDIFQKENLRSIAGGISGYAEINGKGVILVDNSTAGKDQIEIVDAGTFKSLVTIPSSEIENPRSIIKVSDTKAFITAWDATGDFSNFYINPGYVAVLDLVSNKITKKIPVQNGAETLIKVGNEVYVGNTGSGKTALSIIDIAFESVKQTLEVGANPVVIGNDLNGKLWVYAGSKLQRINTTSKSIETQLTLNSNNASASPSSFVMSTDGTAVYFTHSFYDAADNWKQKGQTYRFNVTSSNFEAKSPFINRLFSGGFGVDPQNGQLYAGLIPSYKQAGFVFRYKPDGTSIDSVKAEIAPSKFFFKD